MPRLRHTKSGAVVSVTEEKVARLGSEWESAESAPVKKATAKKAAPSSNTKKS